MRRLLVPIAALCVGCTVLVDMSGLSGGSAKLEALGDASTADVAAPTSAPDAARVDAAPPGSEPPGTFVDAFDRPDGIVGNAWIESVDNIFSISDNQVHAKSGNWIDLFLHRPASEDVRDVETSAEVRWSSTPPADCDATLTVRVQLGAEISAYATFIDDREGLSLSRIDSGSETFLRKTPLPKPIEAGTTYRLRIRAVGAKPVKLHAGFERSDASGWTTVATVDLEDDSSKRIETAGSVGITSDTNATFAYDVFTRTNL